jgi:hypothetical protein
MRILWSLGVVAALGGGVGCGSSEMGCERNDQCIRGQACLRPERPPGEDAPLGKCVDPGGVAALCYHAADCKDPLVCVLPAGGSPATGGSCQIVSGS